MYKDLDKRSECAREKQRLYRLRKKGVTPSALPPAENVTPEVDSRVTPEFVSGMANWVKKRGKVPVVIPGAIKTVADVPKLTPRSIGMGIDTRLEMQRRFAGGK